MIHLLRGGEPTFSNPADEWKEREAREKDTVPSLEFYLLSSEDPFKE